jgi:hypothetical protein
MAHRLRFPTPSSAALVVVAVLLCVPANSLAGGRQTESGESSATALSSAGLLSPGAGYDSRDGSATVRALQARLRRLGHAPGPVDGLFGPLTEGAVERFQEANGLVVDGIVGPRTRKRLAPGTPKQSSAQRDPAKPPPPAPASEPAPDAPSRAEPGAGPEPEPSGLQPGQAALLGALAMALLAAGLWALRGGRRPPERESRINLGMVGAALLGVFVIGAAGGALFATEAAPDDLDEPPAGGLHVTSPDRPRAIASVAEKPRPRRARRATSIPAAPQRTLTVERAARLAEERRAAPAAETRPARPVAGRLRAPQASSRHPRGTDRGGQADTYTVETGDSLWPIAKELLGPNSSRAAVARRVKRLVALNINDRITSGDPDLLVAGEQLKVR